LKALAKPDFAQFTWDEVRATLIGVGLTKYCDYNLVNMINQDPAKDTLEVRILPGMMDAEDIIRSAAFFAAFLRWCCDVEQAPVASLNELIAAMRLEKEVRDFLSE